MPISREPKGGDFGPIRVRVRPTTSTALAESDFVSVDPRECAITPFVPRADWRSSNTRRDTNDADPSSRGPEGKELGLAAVHAPAALVRTGRPVTGDPHGRTHHSVRAHDDVQRDPAIGWSLTTLPQPIAALYSASIGALQRAITLHRRSETAHAAASGANLAATSVAAGATAKSARSSVTRLWKAPPVLARLGVAGCDGWFGL